MSVPTAAPDPPAGLGPEAVMDHTHLVFKSSAAEKEPGAKDPVHIPVRF